jgi:hypothetical protein
MFRLTEKEEEAINQNPSLLYLADYILGVYHIQGTLAIVL